MTYLVDICAAAVVLRRSRREGRRVRGREESACEGAMGSGARGMASSVRLEIK
jgi:hypothetical protein